MRFLAEAMAWLLVSAALFALLWLVLTAASCASDAALSLKWPNDLMLGPAKAAGILLERSGDRVVAGFGVNLAVAPAIEGRATASLNGAITPQAFALRPGSTTASTAAPRPGSASPRRSRGGFAATPSSYL